MSETHESGATRREFLKGATAAALMASGNYAFAQSSDIIKVGLIGCGGRGTGAAADALQADPGARLVAMGDVYKSAIESSLRHLLNDSGQGEKVQVKPDNQFVGLDSCACDCAAIR